MILVLIIVTTFIEYLDLLYICWFVITLLLYEEKAIWKSLWLGLCYFS